MMEDGYTTNYAASWFLVRGGMKLQPGISPPVVTTTGGLKGLSGSTGPLTRSQLEHSALPASTISFMGVAAPGDTDEAILVADLPGKLGAGEQLAEAFNDGPAISVDGSAVTLIANKSGIRLSAVTAAIETVGGLPNGDTIPAQQGMYLQDTRDWFAWGGTGKKKHVNLLQADGSVISVTDENGDGFLNPGFLVTAPKDDAARTIGYTDGVVELPPSVSFSGPVLKLGRIGKEAFED